MFSPHCLRELIRTSLIPLGWWSQEAEELLLMTSAHESHLGHFTVQVNGPALGLYQMEPSTLFDMYENWLDYRPADTVKIGKASGVTGADLGQLRYNPVYSTIMARIKYLRAPGALPPSSDLWAMAEYAKDNYNTHRGKASVQEYHDDYRRLVLR